MPGRVGCASAARRGSRLIRRNLTACPRRAGTRSTEPTGEREPTPNQRTPPRQRRTETRRATAGRPELNWESNPTEIQTGNCTLNALPPDTGQHPPTPGGPDYFCYGSHTFLESHSKSRQGRWQGWTRRNANTPSAILTSSSPERSGRAHSNWLQVPCQPLPFTGGWRGTCLGLCARTKWLRVA